jgi:hypothetical protein
LPSDLATSAVEGLDGSVGITTSFFVSVAKKVVSSVVVDGSIHLGLSNIRATSDSAFSAASNKSEKKESRKKDNDTFHNLKPPKKIFVEVTFYDQKGRGCQRSCKSFFVTNKKFFVLN